MSDTLQAEIVVMILIAIMSFSSGYRFHRDCCRWKASHARKQLGRAVLNTLNL